MSSGSDCSKAEFDSLFTNAKANDKEPGWVALSKTITQKYNVHYAELLIISRRLTWFNYLTTMPNKDQYWPQYVTAWVTKMNKFKYDTVSSQGQFINNLSWQIFQHGNDKAQLLTVANWVKNVMDKNPDNLDYMDTYACVLYKAGKVDEAIALEEKALQISTTQKRKDKIDWSQSSIAKMKSGEQIWTEKEYIN